MTQPPDPVGPLIAEIRHRVDERRKTHFYPEGLENELDAHFRRIVAHRREAELSDLRGALALLEARGLFSPDRIPFDTSVPGGEHIHRLVSKVVARQTQGILEQVQEFGDAVRMAFDQVLDALQDPYGHVHADVVAQLDALWERMATWERGPVESAAALADLRRRVEALEADERRRRFTPTFSADAFEARFRGSEEDIKERYRDVAERFDGLGPVLDIGCGRGEFLELLASRGVEARGVELDTHLVAEAVDRGLDVVGGDGIIHLASLPDRSLGGIVLLQVVEHLPAQQLVDLVAIAREKLADGGLLFAETVNPQSLYTYAHSFYLDPTHSTPVHPAYLHFLFQEAGWSHVEIEWRTPPPADDMLEASSELGPVAAANVERLNRLLFAPQDYAIVARR